MEAEVARRYAQPRSPAADLGSHHCFTNSCNSHLPSSRLQERVKEEDHTHASRYSALPTLNTSLPPRYDSPVHDPPPPPPAAYADPASHETVTESGMREAPKRPHSYIDDPIPPPPAKYSTPSQVLPPISEITRHQESNHRPTRRDEAPHSYRRYSNDTQSADRYTQSSEYESQRGPMRTPYTSAPGPRTPSLDEPRRRSFSSDPRPMYQVPAPADSQSSSGSQYYDQHRSGYSARAEESYYRSYSPRPAYPQHASSRELMPPPPGPATGSTIYTPSLSNPHTPQSNGTYPPYQSTTSRDDGLKSRKPFYGAEIKRHLDIFDLEQALNTVRPYDSRIQLSVTNTLTDVSVQSRASRI